MAKQQGQLMLIKIGDGEASEVFSTLCGLTSKTFTINDTAIDVTTANCTDPTSAMWTELLQGIKSVSVSGNGLFVDHTTETRLMTVKMSASPICNFELVIPDFGELAGAFHIAEVGFGAEDGQGGVTKTLSLNSTGTVTFTAA